MSHHCLALLLLLPCGALRYPAAQADAPDATSGGTVANTQAAYTAATLTRDAIHRRLRHDMAAIREKAAKPDVPEATRAAVTAALDAVAQAMATDTAPPDDPFQAMLPLNPLHRRIFAAVGTTFDRWPLDAPEFQTAVGQWATFWCRHAAQRGIDPAQLNVLLVDEPHSPEQDATIVAWAQAIKESGADLTIWEDPTYHRMSESQQAMVDAVLERGVSSGLMWHDPMDRTLADAGRIAILKALLALQGVH